MKFLLLLLLASGPVDLNLTSTDGAKVHLKDLRGKVVVINFWATWCGPCREEMPMLVEAEKDWNRKGVVFIGASLDDKKTRSEIPEFVARYEVKYPVWLGATVGDLIRMRLAQGVPDTVFIDEQGVVFSRVKGQIRRSELDERLAWITGGRKDPAPVELVDHFK